MAMAMALKEFFILILAFHYSKCLLHESTTEIGTTTVTMQGSEPPEPESVDIVTSPAPQLQQHQPQPRIFLPVLDDPGPGGPVQMMNGTNTVVDFLNYINMFISAIPAIKLTIFGSFLALAIPSLHVVLILSLIAFSLAGTVTLICSTVDCHNGFGLWSRSSASASSQSYPFYTRPIWKKNSRNWNSGQNLENNNYNFNPTGKSGSSTYQVQTSSLPLSPSQSQGVHHHQHGHGVPIPTLTPPAWNLLLDNTNNFVQQSLDESYEKFADS